jgi:hypothetical protein
LREFHPLVGPTQTFDLHYLLMLRLGVCVPGRRFVSRGRRVAVGDVVGDGPLGALPVGVVGVVEDERLDRSEVALDSVQVAAVGGVGTSSTLLLAAKARIPEVQLALRLSCIQ